MAPSSGPGSPHGSQTDGSRGVADPDHFLEKPRQIFHFDADSDLVVIFCIAIFLFIFLVFHYHPRYCHLLLCVAFFSIELESNIGKYYFPTAFNAVDKQNFAGLVCRSGSDESFFDNYVEIN